MIITKTVIAEQIAAYLHHELRIEQLVDWAEHVMLEGALEAEGAEEIASVIARLGVADVRAFGLVWDDCEALLRQLGYRARVEIVSR